MNTTNTGLKDIDSDIKKSLVDDAIAILNLVNSETGYLGDIASGLRTVVSSVEIKITKISTEFKKQKSCIK